MSRFKNDRKSGFLGALPDKSLDDATDDLTARSKFNFSYFDIQPAGQAFNDWDHDELSDLLGKLQEFSRSSLDYWVGQKTLVFYNSFPIKSDFTRPKHVPHQARWGRFRLKQKVRLVGFVVPTDYHDRSHPTTGARFDRHAFYVVFLDRDHKFWITEDP